MLIFVGFEASFGQSSHSLQHLGITSSTVICENILRGQ